MAKVFVDASEAAKIVFSDGAPPIAALTLQEAVIEYGKLDAAKRMAATIETASGQKFGPEEISQLHYK
jgi:hypothetical protein